MYFVIYIKEYWYVNSPINKIKSRWGKFNNYIIFSFLRMFFKYFNFLGEKFIIYDDFNAKNVYWESIITTTKGKELHQSIIDQKCKWQTYRLAKLYQQNICIFFRNIVSNFIRRWRTNIWSIPYVPNNEWKYYQ